MILVKGQKRGGSKFFKESYYEETKLIPLMKVI